MVASFFLVRKLLEFTLDSLMSIVDTRKGESVFGFYVRAGFWIDGIQILTTLGRRSAIFGNPTGGSG